MVSLGRIDCQNPSIEVSSSQKEVIASKKLREACPALSKLTLTVDQGQRINISFWNFNSGERRPITSIRDVISGNMAELRIDVRHEHVMMSVGNKVEVNLNSMTSDTVFLLEINGTRTQIVDTCSI